MSKKRRKQPPGRLELWEFGALLAIVGPASYFALDIIWPLGPLVTNELKGQAFGRGAAAVASVIVGLAMIVIHFVRRR